MDQSRKALVTGASAGLGRAIVIALAREGYDLALTDLDTAMLKDTLAHPDVAKRKTIPIALDLRSQASIAAAFDRALAGLGELDLLVNNAGRALVRPSVDVTEAEWDDVIDTNLKGAFFLSQLFGRNCIARKRPGAIVSMASTHGMIGIPERAVYGISKAGLIQMTRMLAIEWAAREYPRQRGRADHRDDRVAPADAERSCHARRNAVAHPDRPLRHARGGRRRGGLSREPAARPRSPATR